MELIERAGFLSSLQNEFNNSVEGEGHCILLCGEAGMGKTSLVRAFCRKNKSGCKILQGSCDALFTPRPLAPLYDIAWQLRPDLWQNSMDIADRNTFFNSIFQELSLQRDPVVIVFEDIHWADEATLDFIKFLARRIARIHCLFILTYRDNEIHSRHPLRSVLGQLPSDSFTRLQLLPLSKEAVEKMALEKGYNGKEVYSISSGNPFYVNEILASYSPGVPDNIKDSILSVYNARDKTTKQLWETLSVLPTGLELRHFEKIDPSYTETIELSFESKILVLNEGLVTFKHELYRRTIESSLSPLLRIVLNKKILDIFLVSFEKGQERERIIHHAKEANEYELIERFAPLAARQAAAVGAHIEASGLYLSAIEYYRGGDQDTLMGLYEAYAYECYLTNRIKEAIRYQEKSLKICEEKNDIEKTGNCLRFLSRLWWYDGNHQQAESYALQAIEALKDQPASKAKAMAFSNMSQLKMLANLVDDCLKWGEKALGMATDLADEEIRCHALNNIGTLKSGNPEYMQEGIKILQESLATALEKGYHEHAARAYTNLGSGAVTRKNYRFAREALDEGIHYCEERDLDSWRTYMLSYKAKLDLETGHWEDALRIANELVRNEEQTSIIKVGALAVTATIKMRRGDKNIAPLLLEAKTKAFEAMELQRMIPALVAALEYEWITGEALFVQSDIDHTIKMMNEMGNIYENSEFAFWLLTARKQNIPLSEFYEGYRVDDQYHALKAAALWEKLGCPYEQALTLFYGDNDNKRKAIVIIQDLGANAVYNKLKLDMKNEGIENIPRGIRKTTRSNTARLTTRELDILLLLKEGLQNKEIADRLFISAKTVDHHISAILLKLEVHTRVKAVQKADQLKIF